MPESERPQRGKKQHWTYWAATSVGKVIARSAEHALAISNAHPHIQVTFNHKWPRTAILMTTHEGLPYSKVLAEVSREGIVDLQYPQILRNIREVNKFTAVVNATHRALKKYAPKKQ